MKEKIIAIGDIHARSIWKKIVKTFIMSAYKIVFVGDYFDTFFPITPAIQLQNFREILQLKKDYPDQVVLLLGNHDYHYLKWTEASYSGFQSRQKELFGQYLHEGIEAGLLQACYSHKNFIFTHAGITKTWAKEFNIDLENIEQSVNELFIHTPYAFGFLCGPRFDPYGDEVCQSPLWVRPRSLALDLLPGFIQVVGHTGQNSIAMHITKKTGIILIDTLETSKEFLIIDKGEPYAASIKS